MHALKAVFTYKVPCKPWKCCRSRKQLPMHHTQYLHFSLEARNVSDVFVFFIRNIGTCYGWEPVYVKEIFPTTWNLPEKRFIFVTFCKIILLWFWVDWEVVILNFFFKQWHKKLHAKFLNESFNCLAPSLFWTRCR